MLFYPSDRIFIRLPGFSGPTPPEGGTPQEVAAALSTGCAGCAEDAVVQEASWDATEGALVRYQPFTLNPNPQTRSPDPLTPQP